MARPPKLAAARLGIPPADLSIFNPLDAVCPFAPPVVLKPVPEKSVLAFLNALTLYGMGASWGGFESLAIPFDVTPYRSATKFNPGGPCIRLHIGLEDVDDLIADLERGFAAAKSVSDGQASDPRAVAAF